MKTKLEILEETISYYGTDPFNTRGIGSNGCMYLTADGKMCAIGRCCVEPNTAWYGGCEAIRGGEPKTFLELETLLKPEYQGHNIAFWTDLQALHDIHRNFIKTGFSDYGQEQIKKIRERIDSGYYEAKN